MNSIPHELLDILFGSSILPFVQVSILLSLSILINRLLRNHSASLRHAAISVPLFFSPIIFVSGLLDLKPNVTIPVAIKSTQPTEIAPMATPAVGHAPEPKTKAKPEAEPIGYLAACSTTSVADASSNGVSETLACPTEISPVRSVEETPVNIAVASTLVPSTDEERRLSLSGVLLSIWALGAVLVFARFVSSTARLWSRIRKAARLDTTEWPNDLRTQLRIPWRTVSLRESENLVMPLTTGTLRPTILLPADFREWSDLKLRSVVNHEVAHVRRFDPLLNTIGFLSCAVLWFHPLAWIVFRTMRHECEHAADEHAIQSGIKPADYATQLLSVVRNYGRFAQTTPGAVSMVSPSHLRNRIDAVLKTRPKVQSAPARRTALLFVVVLLPIVAASIRLAAVELDSSGISSAALVSRFRSAVGSVSAVTIDTVAAERRKAQREREKLTLEKTKSLRELIRNRQALMFEGDDLSRHKLTAARHGDNLAKLGLFDEAKTLKLQVASSGDEAMVKIIGQFKSSRYQALVDRGDYAGAGEELRPNLGINEYTLIGNAIRAGDILVAEKLVDATYQVKGKKLNKSRMLDTLADLAISAYWLEESEISDRTLRRYRFVLEEASEMSDRPFDEDTAWLTKAPTFGPYFVLVVASCGKADLAQNLWKTAESNTTDEVWSRYYLNPVNICRRLAEAGATEAAVKIAREHNDGTIPSEILHSLCVRALRDGNEEAAKHYANDFLRAVDEFSFTYVVPKYDSTADGDPRRNTEISEQAQVLDKYNKSAWHMADFIRAVRAEGATELAVQAARRYIRLADRYADEFENRSTIADAQQLRRANARFFQFSLENIVDLLPRREILPFASRQQQFLQRTSSYYPVDRRAGPFDAYDVALARIGHPPRSVQKFPLAERFRLMDRLLAAGNLADFQPYFELVYDWALKNESATFVSGSAGGRVVNGATQYRYAVAQLAAKSGQLPRGIQLVDMIEHAGERIDGYRVLGKSYAEATGLESAMAWADSLTDGDQQLAAAVGILEAEVAKLKVSQPDKLNTYLNEIHKLGRPILLWGC